MLEAAPNKWLVCSINVNLMYCLHYSVRVVYWLARSWHQVRSSCSSRLFPYKAILSTGTYKVLSCIGLLRSTHCTEAKIGTRLANAEADEIIVVPLLQGALRKVSRSPLWREQINVEVRLRYQNT